MGDVLVLVLGSGFMVLSIWWFIHLIYISHQSQTEFHHYRSILSTHHNLCKLVSVEGAVKFFYGASFSICAFTIDDNSAFIKNKELVSISMFIAFLGLNDLHSGYFKKPFIEGFEAFLTCVLFLICAIIMFGNSAAHEYPIHNIYSLSCLLCVAIAVCILVEFRMNNQVLFGFMRTYLIFLLGSWLIQANYIIKGPILQLTESFPVNITMIFTWHCVIDIIIMISLWSVVYRLCEKEWCFCLSSASHGQPDMCLENRVHFDMKILGRLEESENEET